MSSIAAMPSGNPPDSAAKQLTDNPMTSGARGWRSGSKSARSRPRKLRKAELESALRAIEERYRAVVEDSTAIICRFQVDGTITFVNQSFCRIFGKSCPEWLGTNWPECAVAEDVPTFTALLRSLSLEKRILTTEHRVRAADGEVLWLECVNRAFLDTAGEWELQSVGRDITARKEAENPSRPSASRAIGYLGTEENITELKQAGVALRESELRFRSFVEASAQVVWTVNAGAEVDLAIPAWQEFTGQTEEEARGLGWMNAIHPDDRPRVAEAWRVAIETRGLYEVEYRLRIHDGTWREIQARGVPIRNADGTVREYIGTCIDITPRKRTEAALRESEEVFRAIFDQSTVGMVQADPVTGRFLRVNPAFCQFTGYSEEDLLERTFLEITHSGDRARDAAKLRALREGRLKSFESEKRYVRPDARIAWGHVNVNLVHDASGGGKFTVGVIQDITERKQAEAELHGLNLELEKRVLERTQELAQAKEKADAANRAKSVFLANMSHEIRTPLNAVLGFTQLLLGDVSTGPEQRQRLSCILRSGEYLLSIMNEILEMARIESGQSRLNPEALDLHGMLYELETIFTLRAQEKRIAFSVEFAPGLPRFLMADSTKLRQIITNLLSNALKFTPTGGRVILRLQAVPESVGQTRLQVEVEDSGCGVCPEDAERVFEPFFQTDSGRAAGGTGLGLSISREFAWLMGGDLTVRSDPGVGGSLFQLDVLLPLAEEVQLPPDTSHRQVFRLDAASAGYRVLVVDDSRDNCEVLSGLLRGLDFNVRTAHHGLEAVQQSRAWSPGLVILDLRMPVMDGYEACRTLRAEHGQILKILILSANISAEARQNSFAAGADAFLCKPYKQDELLECIRNLIGVAYATEERLPHLPGEIGLPAAEAVRSLPSDLVTDLRKALRAADYERMLILANQSSAVDASLGQRLCELIEHIDYEALEAILEPV